jgi:hypothetical protein
LRSPPRGGRGVGSRAANGLGFNSRAFRAAAQPIPAPARPAFFEAIDKALGGGCVLGAGLVARTCAEVQRRFIAVPDAPPVVDGRR